MKRITGNANFTLSRPSIHCHHGIENSYLESVLNTNAYGCNCLFCLVTP